LKCTDNNQLNDYFKQIKSTNSFQMKKFLARSKDLPEKNFKTTINTSIHISQKVKIALQIYNNMQPHSAIQKYFIENDKLSVATELPVRSSKYNVGGFIDLLRYDPKNNIVEIMDYKRGGDKYGVAQQLWKYRLGIEEIFDGKIFTSYFTDREYIRVKFD